MIYHAYTAFSPDDIQSTHAAMKIGILATINPEGLPHMTLLSSLMACSPNRLCFGQFTEGMSKKNILENPRTGFLIMGLDKSLWCGTANYAGPAKAGLEYDYYNNVPMFRYNAYFGVHTVHYLELVAHTGRSDLPMNQVVASALETMMARTLGKKPGQTLVINDWTCGFLNKMDNLKFLSYVGEDGFPVIVPAIQTQCLDRQHLIFATSVYSDELEKIPSGSPLCVFGMALTMEDVLLRGTFQGISRVAGILAGVVEVDWVYNPMPPVPGQVYPPVELKPVLKHA